jgi:hypothetical protein
MLQPIDVQNVRCAKFAFSLALEQALRKYYPELEDMCDFMKHTREFYHAFSHHLPPVDTTHASFMQQKKITLAAAAGYFETWSEACSARYGKVAGSKEVTGCISQETLHSIKITCENAPQIMLRCAEEGIELNTHALSTNTVESFFSVMRARNRKPSQYQANMNFNKSAHELSKKLVGGGGSWYYSSGSRYSGAYDDDQRTEGNEAALRAQAVTSLPPAKKKRAPPSISPTDDQRQSSRQRTVANREFIQNTNGGLSHGKHVRTFATKSVVFHQAGDVVADAAGHTYWLVRTSDPGLSCCTVSALCYINPGSYSLDTESHTTVKKVYLELRSTVGARVSACGTVFTGVALPGRSVLARGGGEVGAGGVWGVGGAGGEMDGIEMSGQDFVNPTDMMTGVIEHFFQNVGSSTATSACETTWLVQFMDGTRADLAQEDLYRVDKVEWKKEERGSGMGWQVSVTWFKQAPEPEQDSGDRVKYVIWSHPFSFSWCVDQFGLNLLNRNVFGQAFAASAVHCAVRRRAAPRHADTPGKPGEWRHHCRDGGAGGRAQLQWRRGGVRARSVPAGYCASIAGTGWQHARQEVVDLACARRQDRVIQ